MQLPILGSVGNIMLYQGDKIFDAVDGLDYYAADAVGFPAVVMGDAVG